MHIYQKSAVKVKLSREFDWFRICKKKLAQAANFFPFQYATASQSIDLRLDNNSFRPKTSENNNVWSKAKVRMV